MCMLRLFFSVFAEFQAPPIGLEYELQRVESFTIDPFGRKYSCVDMALMCISLLLKELPSAVKVTYRGWDSCTSSDNSLSVILLCTIE